MEEEEDDTKLPEQRVEQVLEIEEEEDVGKLPVFPSMEDFPAGNIYFVEEDIK